MMVSCVTFIFELNLLFRLIKVYKIILIYIKRKLLIFDISKLLKFSALISIIQVFKFKEALRKFVRKNKNQLEQSLRFSLYHHKIECFILSFVFLCKIKYVLGYEK